MNNIKSWLMCICLLPEIRRRIIAMHKADVEYGCGSYGNQDWIEHYESLADMVGFDPVEYQETDECRAGRKRRLTSCD